MEKVEKELRWLEHFKPLLHLFDKNHPEYKEQEIYLLEGGRGSGKTMHVAMGLILAGSRAKINVACVRDSRSSMDASVMDALQEGAIALGMEDEFEFQGKVVKHKITGSKYTFHGSLFGVRTGNIKGLYECSLLWYEEASLATIDTLSVVTPTIRGTVDVGGETWGRKMIFVWNTEKPRIVGDDVLKYYKTMMEEEPHRVYYNHSTYKDNSLLPESLDREARMMEKADPELYSKVWLGEPLADIDGYAVIRRQSLVQCINSLHTIKERFDLEADLSFAPKYLGFDVGGGKEKHHDASAVCVVQGPLIVYLEDWREGDIYQSVNRALRAAREYDCEAIYYDVVGLGLGVRSEFVRMDKEGLLTIPYYAVNGGARPNGHKFRYDSRTVDKSTNGDMFFDWNGQSWSALRRRVQNTVTILNTDDDELRLKLFTSGEFLCLPKEAPWLDTFITEACQAMADSNSAKFKVIKAPLEKDSPNMVDSCRYAYAHFHKRGLFAPTH